jgi:sortase A
MKRIIAGLVMVGALGVFGYTLAHAVWLSPELEVTDNAQAPSHAAKTHTGRATDPAHLSIPSLAIDASVQNVGIAKSGNMAVPTNYTDVGWYKYGPGPGEPGNMVFDGHVDNGFSLPGVFKKLNTITKGSDIFIETGKGVKYHYTVTEVSLYPYKSVPTQKIFTKSGEPGLVLITCDGAWIQGEKTYNTRLVVYATLVSQG